MQTYQEYDLNESNNSCIWSNIQFLLNTSCEAFIFTFNALSNLVITLLEYLTVAIIHAFVILSVMAILDMIISASIESILPGLIGLCFLIIFGMIINNNQQLSETYAKTLAFMARDLYYALLMISVCSMFAYLANVPQVVAIFPGPALPVLIMFAYHISYFSISIAMFNECIAILNRSLEAVVQASLPVNQSEALREDERENLINCNSSEIQDDYIEEAEEEDDDDDDITITITI